MPKFFAASLLTLAVVVSAATGCGSDTSSVKDAIGETLDAGTGGFGTGTGGATTGAGGSPATGAGGATTGAGGATTGTGGTPSAGSGGAAAGAGGTAGSAGGAAGAGGSAECDPAFCPQDSFGTPCCVEATGECGVDMGMGCVQTMPSDSVDGG